MHQFFVEPAQIQGKRIRITGGDVNHIKNVLRLKPGDEIAVLNGADNLEYRCGIDGFTDEEVLCTLRFIKEDGLELPSKVYLFQSIPKADKMDFIVQKAVELGAFEIIPVASKRCIVKLDEKKAAKRGERWQGIAESAAKQSRRRLIPEVRPVMGFAEAVSVARGMDLKFIPYELAEGMETTREAIENVKPGQTVAVFIGPEGGFDESEITLAAGQGILPISLGKRILRTETAGLAILSWIMYRLEIQGI